MASIHSLFDEITNEDAFAQPKQVPTLHEWSSGILQDFGDFTSTFRRDSPQAKNQYGHEQLALTAQVPQQIIPPCFYAMDHDWVDTSIGFTSSSLDGPSYYGSFAAPTIAPSWPVQPQYSHYNNTPRFLPSAEVDQEVQHPLAMASSISPPEHRPAKIWTLSLAPIPRPQISPISPINDMTGITTIPTPTYPSPITASTMPSPTPTQTHLEPAHSLPSRSRTSKKPTTRRKSSSDDKARDDPDNRHIYLLRHEHMEWCDVIKAMIARDATMGKRRKWTQAMVYGRWFRNAEAIHDEYYRDDKEFDFDTLRLQKKETSSGKGWKKRKMALRLETARLKSEQVGDGKEEQLGDGQEEDDDEDMVDQNEKDQDTAAANAEDGLSAQFDRASVNPGLGASANDLTTLRSCYDQVVEAQKAELWSLVADRMNDRAEGETSSAKKRWYAAECEAALAKGAADA